MKIVHLTPGTGNFHCGSCHRDNHLVKALRRRGHSVVMVPLYLPLVTDGPPASEETPIFLGGINLFLQQKFSFFRRSPRWLDKVLDAPKLLLSAVKRAHMTSARDLGAMTVASFQGTYGPQAKEWRRLLTWMVEQEKPDLVSLSNGLLNGLAPSIKQEMNVPVICSLQGEDSFLDALPESYREQSWNLFRKNSPSVARYVATSQWYAQQMRSRLQLGEKKIVSVYNGLDFTGYAPAPHPPDSPTIGYLARLFPGKGLDQLITAFIELKRRGHHEQLRLALGGTMTAGDEPYVKEQRARLASAGLTDHVIWRPNLTAEEKIRFLQSLTLLSVPATYGEAFGLYVLEALACGVPVVEPDHAGLAELVTATGGGILYDHSTAAALADALDSLLHNPSLAISLARVGYTTVHQRFTADVMAENFERVCQMPADF